jgi:hypothetical protein
MINRVKSNSYFEEGKDRTISLGLSGALRSIFSLLPSLGTRLSLSVGWLKNFKKEVDFLRSFNIYYETILDRAKSLQMKRSQR